MGQIQNCRHHIQEFGEEQEVIEITIKESMKVDGDYMCSKQKNQVAPTIWLASIKGLETFWNV
jgi:hypothetical protein